MTRHSAASFGRVRLMVKWIDEHHGAFTISRLIMMTGLKLRSYDETSADDPAVMAKLEPAVRSVLSPAEWAELAAFIDG